MVLKLFPQRPDHPLADSKEFKRILAEILVDRPVKAIDELTGWYQSLKHAENFRLDHYLDVIRQLDDAAQPHLRRLERDYLYSPHLSPIEQQRLWTESYNYWGEVAAIYGLCVQRAQLDPKGKGTERFKGSLPLVMTRVQAAFGAQVRWLAYCYGSVGEGLWRKLGETYLAAEAASYAQKPVQLYSSLHRLSSVAQQYLHSIVLFTSSMDSLLPPQIDLADRLVAHFSPGFVFSRDCRPDSVYWVDAVGGLAPARLARPPGMSRPGLRFFSPGPALTALTELIHLVERGDVPPDLNLGGEYPPKVLLPVLHHLRVYWALRPPQRRHQRHSVKTRMVVVHGFDHCHAVFAGAAAHLTGEAGVQHWLVENVSLGGFRACLDDSKGERIKLGSLFSVQPEGGENWLLGVARRFNRLAGARAVVGVQVLSRQARSVELHPRRSGFSTAIPGIYLRDGGEPGLVRIVLPQGGFNVRESLDFNQDGRSCVLIPVELEESGGDYEIARFREQSPG